MLGLGPPGVYGTVVVLGAGTLGLLAASVARSAGARHVIVTDRQPRRLETARRLGADVALDPAEDEVAARVAEVTSGGADLVIEAVGIEATRRQAVQLAAPGGTVVLLGNAEPESELPVVDVVNREIVLRGSYSCTDEELRRAVAFLAGGRIDSDGWVETTTLERGQEIFERLASDPAELVKVMFQL
jgi:threonine dehydrogenase-like Zn-dependent dehydrogenase